MPGGGDLFPFLTRRPEFCTEKLSLGGDFDEKSSGLGVEGGGGGGVGLW